MKKTSVLISVLIVLLVFAAAYEIYREGQAGKKMPTEIVEEVSETEGWLTLTWGGFAFQYPPTWKLRKNTYQTPAQAAEGIPPETVGYFLIYREEPRDGVIVYHGIEIGGRQNDCRTLVATACVQDPLPTIFTVGDDPEIFRVFDILVKTAQKI